MIVASADKKLQAAHTPRAGFVEMRLAIITDVVARQGLGLALVGRVRTGLTRILRE